jgi:hypothetical protein
MDWINLPQDTNQLAGSCEEGYQPSAFTKLCWATGSFSRRIQFHGVTYLVSPVSTILKIPPVILKFLLYGWSEFIMSRAEKERKGMLELRIRNTFENCTDVLAYHINRYINRIIAKNMESVSHFCVLTVRP